MMVGQTIRLVLRQLRARFGGVRASLWVLPVLFMMLAGCVGRSPKQRHLDDATISRKIVGDWEGSASIYNPRSKANETFFFKNRINSDGTFSTANRLYDSTGQFVREMGWGGTFVVSN